MGLVLIVVLGDMVEVESIVPSTFLNRKITTFYFSLETIDIWLRDLDLEILVIESSGCW